MATHNHGGSPSSSSTTTMMPSPMEFINTENSTLFHSRWTPSTTGGYAATCIFLIFLAIVARALLAFKHAMDQRWLAAARARRYVVVADETPPVERAIAEDPDAKTASLITARGVEEKVRVVYRRAGPPVMAWRFSTDIPRAALVTLIVGVGYLLMLAVMTMNVGYFLSILGGVFIGDLLVGRYAHRWEEH